MARIPGLRREFRFPWRSRRQISEDVDDEIAFHLEMRSRELVDQGLSAAAARRQAGREFGDLERARRSLRVLDAAGERRARLRRMLDELRQDLRYGLRMLLNTPGFTAVGVMVLALGIGVNLAVFSVVNLLMLRPRAVDRPEQLVGVYSQSTEDPTRYRAFSYPTYVDLRERSSVFAELAAQEIARMGVAEGEVTRRVMAGLVSANFFATMGVPLAQGRAFTAEEEHPGSSTPVVVVSHAYWEERGSDPDPLGKTLLINGQSFSIVGIARQGFSGTTVLFSPDLWLPLGAYDATLNDSGAGRARRLDDRQNHALMLFGRLQPGLNAAAAEPELERLAAQLEEQYPLAQEDQTIALAPLPRMSISTNPEVGERSGFLLLPTLMLMAMAGVVLLIACLNLANMMIARGAARRTEMAIRLSLGGGRWRLLRQLLTEGLILAILGGVVGLALAYASARLLVASFASLLPFGQLTIDLGPDARVLVVTFCFCLLATLFFALGPAWRLTRPAVLLDLKEQAAADAGGGRRRGRLRSPRNLLVVAQIALSLVLLTAGGLFIRAATAAGGADPGFSLEGRLLVELDPSLIGYGEERSREVHARLLERLRSLPGVEAASLASIVPFGPVVSRRGVQRVGDDAASPEESVTAHYYRIGDEYFRTLGLPVLRGREFNAAEATFAGGPAVAIVDEPLAELLFPGRDPLGQQIQLPGSSAEEAPRTLEVVGLVVGTRHQLIDQGPVPHLYVPFGQDFLPNVHLHLRLAADGEAASSAMLATVREEIRAFDERLPVLGLKTLLQHRDDDVLLWMVQAGANVFTLFGSLALFLAVVGVYGVKAYVVSRRTRELGIRTALGARPGELVWLMVREGLTLTLIGLALGWGMAIGVGRLLSSMLYEVSASDPLVLLTAPLLLAGAALLAAYVPARRAIRIAPTAALRYE